MKRLLGTLFGKISIIFLLLIFFLGLIQMLVSVQSSMDFVCESDQRINQDLAANLAGKFAPFLNDSLDHEAIRAMIHELMVMNPTVEIYLLHEDGTLLGFFGDSTNIVHKKVAVEPIHTFLNRDEKQRFPIMGVDPRSYVKKKIFSAERIRFNRNQEGFLYVIIGGELYDSILSSLRGSYILSTSFIAILVTLVFGAIVGLILFFFLTKRLHKMTDVVQEFEEGSFSKRIPVGSGDDVGRLALAFNNMAERIEENVKTLKKNDKERRDFIANISHDLRSPLASIQGYLETIIMKDAQLSTDERRKFMDTMYHNVTNLNHLVHQLFELSKLDSMESKPDFEAFSIGELVQDVVLKYKPQAEKKKINLETKIPLQLPLIIGDIGMIDRVLSNLVDNALRYTGNGGHVRVEVQPRSDHVCVHISDTGPGIPAEDLPHIFDRFYRVDKSRSRRSGGTGIGLTIVKRILNAHDTTITAESEVGMGTTFSFALKIQ